VGLDRLRLKLSIQPADALALEADTLADRKAVPAMG
jgi:hypothetical protein